MNKSQPKSVSVWNYKPWWCQPWSIILTSVGIIGGSWVLLRTVWITAGIAVPIGVWLGYFLVIYPRLMAKYLAEYPDDFHGDP